MKQSDLFSIILIAAIGTLFSYFAVNTLLGDPDLNKEDIKTIEAISADVLTPDPELFNPKAINPTVEVYVGDCEDIDHNGILSHEELVACGKVNDDGEVNNDDNLKKCADGSLTDDLSKCPENIESEEPNEPEGSEASGEGAGSEGTGSENPEATEGE